MKTKKRFELDAERLATTTESGSRVYLYPEDVQGKWKDRRTLFYWFLILFYLVMPWIYINGKPSIQLNIFTREFTIMGYTLHGVEPILIFLTVISTLFLFALVTSIFGRVWCGWGCPQTVFIHTIFSKIETLIEGKARARKALDAAPWNLNKVFRRSLKWICFTVVCLHIAHTFIGYIIGPRELFSMSMQNPAQNPGIFSAVMIVTAIFLFDFGWFREQFCIIACPYGRMQSVVMDNNSLIIAYDKKRGEPRRGLVPYEQEGDCINCYACVKVCPTGIDIRRGTQLECIACTNCIDACDEIMFKIKKPQGLIRYSSENELNGQKHQKITIRTVFYFCILTIFISTFIYFVSHITKPNMVFIRGTDSPFQVVTESDGKKFITNHFTLKVSHQGDENLSLHLQVNDPTLRDKIQIISPIDHMLISTPEVKAMLFFKFSTEVLEHGSKKIKLNLIKNNEVVASEELMLVGPN